MHLTAHANAFCERVIGTIRRECLDWMILLNEAHLRRVLREWVTYYNRGRPHARAWARAFPMALTSCRCGVAIGFARATAVVAAPILGGLHHEYRLEPRAA